MERVEINIMGVSGLDTLDTVVWSEVEVTSFRQVERR